MRTPRYIHYREGEFWIGWLEEYPDYRTQGESIEELEESLRDIEKELTGGHIPNVRRVGTLIIP